MTIGKFGLTEKMLSQDFREEIRLFIAKCGIHDFSLGNSL